MIRVSDRTSPRPILIIVVGMTLFAGALAAEVLTEPRGWVRVVAWCVAAFGMGMYYREFVQRARARSIKK